MNRKIMVKKIWSLNPTKYEEITLEEASKRYDDYLQYFFAYACGDEAKGFINWLESEI